MHQGPPLYKQHHQESSSVLLLHDSLKNTHRVRVRQRSKKSVKMVLHAFMAVLVFITSMFLRTEGFTPTANISCRCFLHLLPILCQNNAKKMDKWPIGKVCCEDCSLETVFKEHCNDTVSIDAPSYSQQDSSIQSPSHGNGYCGKYKLELGASKLCSKELVKLCPEKKVKTNKNFWYNHPANTRVIRNLLEAFKYLLSRAHRHKAGLFIAANERQQIQKTLPKQNTAIYKRPPPPLTLEEDPYNRYES